MLLWLFSVGLDDTDQVALCNQSFVSDCLSTGTDEWVTKTNVSMIPCVVFHLATDSYSCKAD